MTKYIMTALVLAILFSGCPSAREAPVKKPEPEAPPPKKVPAPGTLIRFACLDIAKFPRKIESADITRLAAQLRADSVEILALQGIIRYPELKNRIDILRELANRTDMSPAFGETITLSGRQGGNAVFSSFPIQSSENTHYEGLGSTSFEAALQVLLDCGLRDVLVVSTQIPEKATDADQSVCSGLLASFSTLYFNRPVIIAGTLPRSDVQRRIAQYSEPKGPEPKDAPRIWYSSDGSLTVLGVRYEKTVLGQMTVAHFGVFPAKNP